MKKKEEKDALKKINNIKGKILSTISDDDERKVVQDLIAQLLSAQAQSDVEEVELVVPTKSVRRSIDLETETIKQTTHGILYTVKGGFSVFIESRMLALTSLFKEFMDAHENNYANAKDEEERTLLKTYFDAWLMLLKTPMLCTLSPALAINIAQTLCVGVTDYAKEHIDNATLNPETEEDVQKNIESANEQALIAELFKSQNKR